MSRRLQRIDRIVSDLRCGMYGEKGEREETLWKVVKLSMEEIEERTRKLVAQEETIAELKARLAAELRRGSTKG